MLDERSRQFGRFQNLCRGLRLTKGFGQSRRSPGPPTSILDRSSVSCNSMEHECLSLDSYSLLARRGELLQLESFIPLSCSAQPSRPISSAPAPASCTQLTGLLGCPASHLPASSLSWIMSDGLVGAKRYVPTSQGCTSELKEGTRSPTDQTPNHKSFV